MFGRVDLAKYAVGASTCRNAFVSFRGGAYSRAGTAFVGFSKQTGRAYPPRLIPFQFSLDQGLPLEFGNQYMRVISDGGFVTDEAFAITGATQANPAVITASASGASVATPINGAVTVSYVPGDTITLAGGSFSTPTKLTVLSTTALSAILLSPGTQGYAPGDFITLAGGVSTTSAVVTVASTQVLSATIVNAGTGGTNGVQTVTGTTGIGVKFQASVTIAGNVITAINSITVPGNYTGNPATVTNEPVTGGGLTSAALSLKMGVLSISFTNGGVFTSNPVGGLFTQGSTTGSGVGATFQTAVFGVHAVAITVPGIYSAVPANPVLQASTSGSGQGIEFTMTWAATAPFATGDWVHVTDIVGMTQLNGRTFVVTQLSPTTFSLHDVYGNNIDSTGYSAYISGGLAARIFTLPTPYAEQDLPWLKFTESADVLSITCWNQDTGTTYPPNDLARIADNNWVITEPTFAATIIAPAGVTAAASTSGTTDYNYGVTAVSLADGSESVMSVPADVMSVDIAATAGSITVGWATVTGAGTYNIYRAPASVSGSVPVGSLFGYVGTAYGTQYTDSNITPDFGQVPPLHKDPFAPGQGIDAHVTAPGSGYTQATIGYTIGTVTGSGLVLAPVVVGGQLVAIIVQDPGGKYAVGDTVTITDSGGGTGATATLTIGPETGTYPSVVAYYQERRVYAASPNNPDTYYMSQPGAFLNFDSRIPTIDTDAITGSPWSVQVNGIQAMVPMPGGLVTLTGQGAWQVTGAGGSSLAPQPITPASQQAQPQAYNGISNHIPPIKINYDILYVQALGSLIRDLSYNFFVNIYTGTDVTELSSHLFLGYNIVEWAYCEEPFKLVWVVRDDGALLSLTYVKEQEVSGWARHDTNGLFMSVCSVIEPPVYALYTAVQRFPNGNNAYMIERMDNRLQWNAETAWCVDAGLALPQPEPAATITASSAWGLGALTGMTIVSGGTGWSSATTATVVDQFSCPGTGAVPVLTIVAGVITAVTFSSQGQNYRQPKLVLNDPGGQGTGFDGVFLMDNSATFVANANVFVMGSVGSVIRGGGGIAVITAYTSATQVTANITNPITACLPNAVNGAGLPVPIPFTSGNWTMTAPVTSVSGLDYLAGATVTGLADGNVVTPRTVDVNGFVTLDTPASAITLGLGFQAQLQSLYIETGNPTGQGQRKRTPAATLRIEASRGLKAGANQPDGSTLSPVQLAPAWNNLDDVPDFDKYQPPASRKPYLSKFVPLYTGDRRVDLTAGFNRTGQVAVQQDFPLPMQVSALIVEVDPGDTPQPPGPTRAQDRGQQANQ